jgi:peptidoglycan hydrolase-like protein with peptidoglycan-binding domain
VTETSAAGAETSVAGTTAGTAAGTSEPTEAPVATGTGTVGPTTSGPECEFAANDELPLQRCDTGPAIAAVQSVLQAYQYGIGTVDCFFGDQTLYALRQFQTDRDLTVNGTVDQETWAALEELFLGGWGDDANGNGTIEPNEITLECG